MKKSFIAVAAAAVALASTPVAAKPQDNGSRHLLLVTPYGAVRQACALLRQAHGRDCTAREERLLMQEVQRQRKAALRRVAKN